MESEKGIQDKDTGYIILRPYVDFFLWRAYRRKEVLGYNKVPKDGAIIYAPNHTNALMDALLVLALDSKPKVFVARADIFKKPAFAKILTFLKILPINRIRDGRENLSKNDDIFEKSVQVLKDKVPFCILPEGQHRAMHSLLPLGKGIFRIALMTEEEVGKEMPLYIVPIGLEYGSFFRFRSTILVQIGDPINVSEYKKRYPKVETPELMNIMKEDLTFRMRDLIQYIPDDEFYNGTYELCAMLYSHKKGKPEFRSKAKEKKGKYLYRRYLTNRDTVERITALRKDKPELIEPILEKADEISKIRVNKRISLKSLTFRKTGFLVLKRIALLLLTLPLYLVYLALTFPVVIAYSAVYSVIKDKAFLNSVKVVISMVLWLLLMLVYIVLAFIFLPWWIAVIALVLAFPGLWHTQDWHRGARLLVSDIKLLFSTKLRRSIKEIINEYNKL